MLFVFGDAAAVDDDKDLFFAAFAVVVAAEVEEAAAALFEIDIAFDGITAERANIGEAMVFRFIMFEFRFDDDEEPEEENEGSAVERFDGAAIG